MAEMISIATKDGADHFDLYVVEPPSGKAPAIIVIPSIWGITDGLKAQMETWAKRGFLVVAPDVFWRTLRGPLAEPADREPAYDRMKQYDLDLGLEDIEQIKSKLATMSSYNGKFAILGFCFGGRLAFLGLTRLGADAAVAFHGTQIHQHLDEAHLVTKPFSFHYGGKDPVTPQDQIDAIAAALTGKDGEIEVYAEAKHGFAQQEASNFDPEAFELSDKRAFAILDGLKTAAVA